ncbi:MAG TPA: YHS domain-containing protein [Nitrospiria bacterium]|nr:YHS domain-containing protein [Nitrospiria bacterium]
MRPLVILILLFGLYVVAKLLIGVSYLSVRRRKRKEASGGEMVKDPVCDTYVPKSRALEKNVSGQTHYFCSQECMDVFLQKGG